MTNTELTKIREDRKLSKKEFADLLGVTAMMIGRYEKGTCAIPESIAEKLKEAEDKAVATEIEVKKNTRKAGRKVKEKAEDTFP
jgi:predicted transcriptional regulator